MKNTFAPHGSADTKIVHPCRYSETVKLAILYACKQLGVYKRLSLIMSGPLKAVNALAFH